MKSSYLNIKINDKNIPVELMRKNIKNVHLKVFRDLKVIISTPVNTPDDWIIDFLNKRKDWINKQLEKYKKTQGHNELLNLKSGTSTQILGKDIRIYKKLSSNNSVDFQNKIINIYLKNVEDNSYNKIFSTFWLDKSREIFEAETLLIFNKIFKKYKIEYPEIKIRKMKTMWGSCNKSKNKITLNEYLLKANIRCIQYVILHELTHLIYNNHNQDFYNFLTIHMPDWQERKKMLDYETILNL